jgi:hypothetical protein
MLIVVVKMSSARDYCYLITNSRCVPTVAVVDGPEGVARCEVQEHRRGKLAVAISLTAL